ncbi:hypothetical protein [Streptantibioticus ferralitis]|uniref:Uncharacterized protein n=1 Tax=Streptantibioticus ferralitis TaxID=236510 RepID=A0ABT5Z6Z4_9ACTN|nr:hypothetical protein [Streptantibioticus ferralitis]MDF2258795.1 hypothetical protein [Streptantibioticus ferralitis]
MTDLSAFAAWAAALTSVATLVVTTVVGGRREQRRWAREALTDAFVAFLEASWRHSDLAKSVPPGREDRADSLRQTYIEMRTQLTRLRLLASEDVLQAGEELLRRQRAVQEAETGETRGEALIAASRGRRSVVAAAKRELGLR